VSSHSLGPEVVSWHGRVPDHRRKWDEVRDLLETDERTLAVLTGAGSPYRTRFLQGAFFAPRVLFWVRMTVEGQLGPGAGRLEVVSDRSGQEREPWKSIPDLKGTIESEFVYPAIQGEHILPFRVRGTGHVIGPILGDEVLLPGTDTLDQFPGLAKWWNRAVAIWEDKRPLTSKGTLAERADYKGGLRSQRSPDEQRVVYAASGSRLVAARLTDPDVLVEKSAYWATAQNTDEARYLTAIFNSPYFDELVEPYQARGIGGSRHFDKVIFEIGVPTFDAVDVLHNDLVAAAKKCEEIAEGVELTDGLARQSARRLVREALFDAGMDQTLNRLVRQVIIPG
jgi:hypothetical protein